MCRRLDLAGRIDALLPAPGRKVSHGEAVVAMVLNALGFVSRPLYLFPEFFENKPLDLLLRAGLEPADLNDDCLGRTMDVLYGYGVTEVFTRVAHDILRDTGVPFDFAHLDTSTFSFHGKYTPEETPEADEGTSEDPALRQPVHITYGYSKDKRSDLKQVVLTLICAHQSTLPIWMEALDGNTSDKKSFPETVNAFCRQLEGAPSPLFVMDSAFYTLPNLAQTAPVRFVTHVPETIKAVGELLAAEVAEEDWQAGPDADHRYRVVTADYGGVPQRWVVVDSRKRAVQDRAAQDRKTAKAAERAETDAKRMSAQRFSCRSDAERAIAEMTRAWPLHQATVAYVEHKQYTSRGRPRKDQPPDAIVWQADVTVAVDDDALAETRQGEGQYVIATNVVSEDEVRAIDLIALYRAQGVSVERGFRFLKDPLFFADAVYLHKPERIMALLMIMTLSLLVYSLTERQVREELVRQKQTLPDQKGKPTATPTLRRIFQMFEGLDLLAVQTDEERQYQVLNLKELHRKILKLFPPEVEKIYLDPNGCGR